MKRTRHLLTATAVVAGTISPVLATGNAVAADGDITSAVLADRDVSLTAAAVVKVPAGTHTCTGVISGTGTLRLSLTRLFNLGTISGTGLITQPRDMWGTLQLCGTSPFSGVVENGTGVDFAHVNCSASLPNATSVIDYGSWIAVLRPGSDASGGDGGLHTKGDLDKVVDEGSLVVRNTATATTLPPVSGTGSLTQAGAAATTFAAASYTGATTVAEGALKVSGAPLAASRAVSLSGARAVLDLTAAKSTALHRLGVVKGARIELAGSEPVLTVDGTAHTVSGASLTVGASHFAVPRSGGHTVLTARDSTLSTAARAATTTPSAAASSSSAAAAQQGDSVTGTPATGAGAGESTAGGTMAETGGDSGMLWGTSGAAAFALAIGAGAFAFVRRSRTRVRSRHGR
jgi:autotransporter-associated beta strand protein